MSQSLFRRRFERVFSIFIFLKSRVILSNNDKNIRERIFLGDQSMTDSFILGERKFSFLLQIVLLGTNFGAHVDMN